MAILVFKGHSTRGDELRELLEMLGDNRQLKGTFKGFYYWIEDGQVTASDVHPENSIIYSLEEFLEKYPYKVGDEVEYKSIGDANLKSKIIYMEWCNALNNVLYTTEEAHVISTEDIIETKSIPPYMDYDIKENIEKNQPPKTQAEVDKYFQEHSVKNGMNVIDIETCLEMDGLKLPENVVINSKGIGSIQFIQWYEKQQYPKTYGECCEILDIHPSRELQPSFFTDISEIEKDLSYKLSLLYKLYICRNAYWKIAGEQMGLGKPWEPDWNNVSDKHCIYFVSGEIWLTECQTRQCTLAFPTEEMRDKFFENYKDLIEQCKELL